MVSFGKKAKIQKDWELASRLRETKGKLEKIISSCNSLAGEYESSSLEAYRNKDIPMAKAFMSKCMNLENQARKAKSFQLFLKDLELSKGQLNLVTSLGDTMKDLLKTFGKESSFQSSLARLDQTITKAYEKSTVLTGAIDDFMSNSMDTMVSYVNTTDPEIDARLKRESVSEVSDNRESVDSNSADEMEKILMDRIRRLNDEKGTR